MSWNFIRSTIVRRCSKQTVIVQIDDESLDSYSGPGIIYLSAKMFDTSRPYTEEKLERKLLISGGQTVGLKSFDDAWLSQGLAEWSAFAYRESTLSAGGPRCCTT